MLKGDLVTTPLPEVLRQLADGVASGCLHVLDGVDESAKVFLRGGQVYAVQVPGRRPQLGARLVSSGSLGPEALSEALEAQRTELQGWRLGELLVHLGYVDQPVVEAFINEQVREQTSDLMRWPTGTWKFRVNERTREDVAPPMTVERLLADVQQRTLAWEAISDTVHGPDAVPVLSAAGQSDAEMAIDPEAWSLLCKVDGSRSIADLARECGFTLYEAGQVVYALVRSGLLEVEEVLVGSENGSFESVGARLAAAFAPSDLVIVPEAVEAYPIPAQAEEPSPSDVANLIAAALRADRSMGATPVTPEQEIDQSIDRVSAALSALLGPTTDESLFAAPRPRIRLTPPKPLTPAEVERKARAAARAEREAKRRNNDAAELAAAQADLEAARAADAAEAHLAHSSDHEAQIVDLEEVRRDVARRDEEAAAQAEAARAAEEVAERARRAQEQVEADQLFEAEAARLAAEQAEAARLAAEQAEAAARAEADRLAAEHAEADRLAAEQVEAARLAQELTDAEADRLAAEQVEATRLAQELAEDEADRLAAEAAEVAARAEADRVAAEHAEADRLAVEQVEAAWLAQALAEDEADRLAAEAAEVAARAEADRLAVEQVEAARLAQALAEDEADRLAAEAAEVAARAEADRVAAEDADVARLAQEHADAEAARVAAESARLAWEEQAAQEAALVARERAEVERELRDAAEQQATAQAAREQRLVEEQAERARAEARAAEQAEDAALAMLAEQRAGASSAFAELSATAASSTHSSTQSSTHAPARAFNEPLGAEPDDDDPVAPYRPADTDMASLFRELSSLGMDDEPAPAPMRPAPTPRTPMAGTPGKKKKGLFGR